MKKRLQQILIATAIAVASATSIKAQTISDFENLTLAKSDTFWDGSATPNGATFQSGNAIFLNKNGGGFWNGCSYSNTTDSSTSGFMNQYSAKAAHGYNNSANYAVVSPDLFGNVPAKIKLAGIAAGKPVNGFYVTNSTFAYNSMRDGDQFAKKFGGATGNDADWFKVTIKKWLGGVKLNDSIEFYLADFRFSNNAQDYILKNWTWVNLTALGNVDSLELNLSSSDNSGGFMNTPAYLCIDNFTTADVLLNGTFNIDNKINIQLFPNPASNKIAINMAVNNLDAATVSIYNTLGVLVLSSKMNTNAAEFSIDNLAKGSYTVIVENSNFKAQNSFIKQ
ncbi:MAG: hypothetical protein RIQ33_1970 [Bacteroidota bacterium]|jgi:hypothetical protein